jgi:hypothetical protein
MFAYNPTANDNSGQILAGYQTKSAEIKAAGNEALAQGIMDGVTSVASGIGGAIAKSQANTAKLQGIQATGSAMQAILPQYGEQGMALGQALQSELGKAGNNPDKMAGAMMAFMPAMENLQSRFNQQANIENYKDLYDYKASLGGPGTNTAPKLDAQYGREFYMGLRNNGRTHEQALQDMRNAGLNWAINDIERPQNQGFFNMPNPAATSTGP